jgi:hypothetical protein
MDEKPGQVGDSKSNSPLNKQMSPLAVGVLGGVAVFAFILYKHHDIVRAGLVGGAAFVAGFLVVLAGTYLDRRVNKKP